MQIASFLNDAGQIIGQKLRYPDKKFAVVGTVTGHLFGRHLWRDAGKRLVITEGEIDALSYNEVTKSWPVVSIPNGAASADKAILANIEWLERFDEVVFAFDNDEPGQKAARKCAALLTPGKGKLAKLDQRYKDFNDALVAGDAKAITNAVWEAAEHRPDGILTTEALWERVTQKKPVDTYRYPWAGLDKVTRGLRKGELVTLTAGSGVGKTALCREIQYDLAVNQNCVVGGMYLEENPIRTALGLTGVHLNRPLHLDRELNVSDVEEDFFKVFLDDKQKPRIHLYDHFGSVEIENLMSRVIYFTKALRCDFIVLDHLSIVISGLEVDDERKAIDRAMTKLRTVVEETGAGLILVSHLRRPSGGQGHEQGSDPQLHELRGSHSIVQLSDMVIAASRNLQADDKHKNRTRVNVLKNRFSGETGYATTLLYDQTTGRLAEATDFDAANDNDEAPF